MSRKPIFGDKSSAQTAARFMRGNFSDTLDVMALKERGREALAADDAAWAAMVAARDAVPVVEVTRKKRVRRARVNTIAPSSYLGGFRVIYQSLDSYVVNLRGVEVREDFMLLLPEAKQAAEELGDMALAPLPPFLGVNLAIKPYGGGTFAYLGGNADVTVKIRKADHAPNIAAAQVELTAACLHRVGWRAALGYLAEWVEIWAPGAVLQPSEVDPCADTQGWVPTLDDFKRKSFVCPVARPALIPYDGDHVGYVRYGTGGVQGSRSGAAPIQCAIYDKTDEIRVHDKGWFVPLWSLSPDYVDGETVTRVEFRFRREYLKERGIETQAQLVEALPALWAEGLEWCRYSVPAGDDGDENRSRWKVRDEWGVLRGLDWGGVAEKVLDRIDQARPRLERTLAAIGGHLVSLQALTFDSMSLSIMEMLALTGPSLAKRWAARGEDYQAKVDDRRLRFGGVSLAGL
jgi:hypothetical protein